MLKDLYSLERVKISQPDLNQMLGQHERYLAKQGGVRAVLRSAKLDGLVLANRNLSDADLTGASLVGANLYGTNLSRATLYCADLRGCDMRNARLERADLRGVSFKDANLSFANMNYADLRAATMMYVGDKFKLQGNGRDASPFGSVDFSNCSLCEASFGNAKLNNANFTDSLLQGATFRGAKLDNACFQGAILFGVNIADLDVPPDALKNSLLAPSPAAEARANDILAALKAHHAWVVSAGKTGKPANVDGEDLRPLGGAVKGLCLAGLSAANAVAVAVDFSSCQLQAAKFDGSDLRMASFANSDLSGASFDRAKLAHANFRNAKIHDLTLRNGDIVHARADNAYAVADQFRGASVQAETFLVNLGGPPPI